jgi:hypothetical protein
LPVSTIALSGVMTRMPLVCMQHRRLGVPVRLRADVDAGDDDVDLAAGLRERDDAPQGARHPVHVLRAAVHRDAGAGGQREPLDGDAALLGEVERGDDEAHSGSRPVPSALVGSPSSATRVTPSG